jgi:S-adenosyl methyltransferase
MVKMAESPQDNDVLPGAKGPTVHGVYDAMRGGDQHMRADRDLAKAIEAEFPQVPVHVRAASDFDLRVTRWCAGRGINRFIRAGAVTWQPDGRNVHDAAPGAQVVYVNRDAEAHGWARALLACDPGVSAVRASIERTAEVLAAPAVAALLAPLEPVCLIIGMVLHFAPPDRAASRIREFAGALPRGSVIAVSLSLPDHSPRADRLLSMYTPSRMWRHTAEDVAGWMEGAGLADAELAGAAPPRVCDIRLLPGGAWASGELPARAPGMTVGAMGLVP